VTVEPYVVSIVAWPTFIVEAAQDGTQPGRPDRLAAVHACDAGVVDKSAALSAVAPGRLLAEAWLLYVRRNT
jgi:hypothetical protein